MMGNELTAAWAEYSKTKLLIGPILTRKLNEFFDEVTSGGTSLYLALDPMTPNGEPRAKLSKEAQEIAYKEIPPILEAIRTEARAVIHG
jgi:hypothetical protein